MPIKKSSATHCQADSLTYYVTDAQPIQLNSLRSRPSRGVPPSSKNNKKNKKTKRTIYIWELPTICFALGWPPQLFFVLGGLAGARLGDENV